MDESFRIRPFGFDRVFDHLHAPGGQDGAHDAQSRIAALEAALALAVHDRDDAVVHARDDGFEAGLAYARSERAAALLAAADALHATIEEVEAKMEEITANMIREAAGAAQAAAEILAGRALVAAPAAAIDEAIGRSLRQVARGQAIDITVHPDLLDEVQALIGRRQAGDRRHLNLSVTADPTLAIGDSHIHWEQGGIVLDASARAANVRATLDTMLRDCTDPDGGQEFPPGRNCPPSGLL